MEIVPATISIKSLKVILLPMASFVDLPDYQPEAL